jgi:hypothetical protein
LNDLSFISPIIFAAQNKTVQETGMGSGLLVAHRRAAERGSVNYPNKVFVITDTVFFLSSDNNSLANVIIQFDKSDIPVIGVGIGNIPHNIKSLFPIMVYSPLPSSLTSGLKL